MAIAKENKVVHGDDLTTVGQLVKSYVTGQLSGKVDKVTGKDLSTNDYTTAEKNKLAGIAAGAEVNVNADWDAVSGDAQILNKPTIPTKTSDLNNDSGFVTASDVPAGVSPATAAPLMDGTAAVGSSAKYAKEDHVHPTDTSRLSSTNPTGTGILTLMTSGDLAGEVVLFNENDDTISLGFFAGETIPQVESTAGSILFQASQADTAIITKGGTIAMTSDITTAISGKADSATTLAGYGITNAYTKTEVDSAIASALVGGFVAAATLPTASASTMGKIYLIPNSGTGTNTKDEYVTINNSGTYSWELLGTTQLDLSNYVTEDELVALTTTEVQTLLGLSS